MSGFAPLSGLLARRGVVWGLLAFAAVEIGITASGHTAWVCPIRAATGVPCPGCGMTHALAAFAHGDLAEAWREHPLFPVPAVLGVFVLAVALLPAAPRARVLAAAGRVEAAFPWWPAAFLLFVAVWAVRWWTGALADL